MQKPDSFWAKMVDDLLVKAPSVVVKALPSSQMQMEMVREEEERVRKRREQLGEAGLREKQMLLEEAVSLNLQPVPIPSLVPDLSSPDLSGVSFFNISSYSRGDLLRSVRFIRV